MKISKYDFCLSTYFKTIPYINDILEFFKNWIDVSIKYFWIVFIFFFFITLGILFLVSVAMIFTPQVSMLIKACLLIFMFLSATLAVTVFKYYL